MTESVPATAERPVRRQQRRSAVTQKKLLDAAIQAFSENGYKGTSTREIADRAGVHHPLITYHFRNKDQLWRAAVGGIFREFNISLFKAMADIPDSDAKAKAETFVRTYVHYAYRQPALHKIILQESSRQTGRLDWLVEHHLKPLFDQVVTYLRKLQHLGVCPAGDPALLFNMIRVSAGGLLALSLEIRGTSGINFDEQGKLDELADMIIRAFFAGDPKTPDQGSSA